MRILVVSDTHRDGSALRRAVLCQPQAQVVIHLGDGADEASEVRLLHPGKMFLQVCGNCDWGSSLPREGDIVLEHRKIFYTHGHLYGVKYGMEKVKEAARARKADVVLFGHTHRALMEYDRGFYVMNPGSLCGGGATYGILDITDAGIVTNIIKLPDR